MVQIDRYITNTAELQHYLKIKDMVCGFNMEKQLKKKVMQDQMNIWDSLGVES